LEGAFTRIGLLIAASGLVNEYVVCFFEVQSQWKAVLVNEFEAIINQYTFQWI
jgi:hypothetical protein